MSFCKKIVSLILAAILLFSTVAFNISAGAYEDVDYKIHSAEWYFREVNEPLCFENVNGSDFIYIVRDNEAVLLSFTTNFKGPEKSVFTLPTVLGGYPVTAIGYEYEDGSGNAGAQATWYIHHGKNVFEEYPEYLEYGYYPDWDPGLDYVSKLVIPEGYRTIYTSSLKGVFCPVSFPKSLRLITGQPFDYLYTHVDENGKRYTVLPECEYLDTDYGSSIIASYIYGDVYFPSRLEDNSADILYRRRSRSSVIYVPSNISTEDFYNTLYYFEGAAGDAGEVWPRRDTVDTIHCAPDSEFLSVFDEYGEHPYTTVITDVVPAEYIEFPKETVNVCVGDVVDLEAKTYPAEAVWTACDYTVSDPSIVQIDDYSGRITALKEGTVTVTATHCERGFVDTCTVKVTTEPEPVSGVKEIKPATDAPYFAYGNRDYKLELTGSPSKIQLIRENGTTTTIDRSKATITSNGETETWVVNMRVGEGNHSIRAKYGKVWDEAKIPFTVTYDTPKAHSFDITYENGIGTFEVVTDPQIAKVQFLLDSGSTLTYSQSYSHIAEDGMRHWTVIRKIPADTNYTLKTKLGYTWTTTDLKVTS